MKVIPILDSNEDAQIYAWIPAMSMFLYENAVQFIMHCFKAKPSNYEQVKEKLQFCTARKAS